MKLRIYQTANIPNELRNCVGKCVIWNFSASPVFLGVSLSLFQLSKFVEKKKLPPKSQLNWVIKRFACQWISACMLHFERLKNVNWMCLLNCFRGVFIEHFSHFPHSICYVQIGNDVIMMMFSSNLNQTIESNMSNRSTSFFDYIFLFFFFFIAICQPKKKTINLFVHLIKYVCTLNPKKVCNFLFLGHFSDECCVCLSVFISSGHNAFAMWTIWICVHWKEPLLITILDLFSFAYGFAKVIFLFLIGPE